MDSFSFLKYLRSSAAAAAANSAAADPTATATIATSVLCPSDDTEEEDDDDHDHDDGPFFDLEFAAMTDDGETEEERNGSEVDRPDGAEADEEEMEREFNFAVSSDGSGGGEGGDGLGFDAFSPSDDLFFKGKLVPFDPSSIVIAAAAAGSEADPKPQFPAYFVRTATKFRIFLLGLRKPKPTPAEPNAATATLATATAASEVPAPTAAEAAASPKKEQPNQNKFFIKFKVVDAPFVSFFARDGSSRNSAGGGGSRPAKTVAEEVVVSGTSAAEAEKKLVKEVVQKYLNKIKPLYVRVSRKYAERLRLTGQLPPADPAGEESTPAEVEETVVEVELPAPTLPAPAEEVEAPTPEPLPVTTELGAPPQPVTTAAVGGGKILAAGLRVVCKRLGKSRSASAAVAAVPSPPPRRRDDSLLQQQDGIQSAIAHCKRSFTAAEQGSESPLVRSMSDPMSNASS
ncbi:hypothetical protein Cni_G17065 [Canna indica]|uniref:Membrane-associated kinase regulator 2 n=1 Tax=Canna indica TaxID=4628 RepID=A0AAQ3KLU0_9LILI|nr:hypothetical protein Cni_G17065 [Canna indica]